jgi:protease PrsW
VKTTVDIAVSMVPVLLFLWGLRFLDSFKLVTLRAVLQTVVIGAAAAFAALVANNTLLHVLAIDGVRYTRYVAPIVEESCKAAYLFVLIRSNKIGFMVDAAIIGFAVGTGFSLAENMFYVVTRPDAQILLWIIRGLGTAIMHGAATGVAGILLKQYAGRWGSRTPAFVLPGLGAAILLHGAFNHFFLSPSLTTVVLLLAFPLIVIAVFAQSERATRQWLGVGFDSDRELLEMITTETLSETRVGDYLRTLETRFPPLIVADILCYLRIYLELSIQAKGLLMMREAGFRTESDPETRSRFEELRYLEKAIGPTGKLAILPFLHTSGHDLWQLNMLESG